MELNLIIEKLRLVEDYANYFWKNNDCSASITIESDGSGTIEVVGSWFRESYDYSREICFEQLIPETFSELIKEIKDYE